MFDFALRSFIRFIEIIFYRKGFIQHYSLHFASFLKMPYFTKSYAAQKL